jgi:outer membrane lipoprotein-sorting protein
MDDPVVKSIKMNGVLFVKSNKYLLTLDDQIIANDGTMMWNYQKSINEASIFNADDDDFLIYHPMKILNNWDKDYLAKIIREEGDNEKVIIIVDLTPKHQLTFYKMRLFIEKSTSYLKKIIIYQVDAPTITYSIVKFNSKDQVEDSKFIFNKNDYPNVQVNDMR